MLHIDYYDSARNDDHRPNGFTMRRLGILTIFVLNMFFSSPHHSFGTERLGASLQNHLAHLKSDEFVPILIIMQERPDYDRLRQLVRDLPRDDRAGVVWRELLELANRSQAEIRSFLENEQEQNQARNIKSLRLCNGIAVEAVHKVIDQLAQRRDVQQVLLNQVRKFPDEEPVDYCRELDSIEWNVRLVQADSAWADGYYGQGVLVAIIDTGVDYLDEDLAGHLWDGGEQYPFHGYDFHNNDFDPMDTDGHGTNCALIATGDGTGGDTTGVAPRATVMILKVREDLYEGVVTNTWLAQDFVIEHGVDVTQMSLGWGQPAQEDFPLWRNNYDILNIAGIVNCKSAGNNRGALFPPDAISVPGGVPSPWRNPDEVEDGTRSGLITVGATYENEVISSLSSPGPVTWMNIAPYFDYPLDTLTHAQVGLFKPDLTAPSSGATSWASPVVAGSVALMLSKNHDLLPVQIDSILQTTALDLGPEGKDNDYGAGRVRAWEAVRSIPTETGWIEGHLRNQQTGMGISGMVVTILERRRRQAVSDQDGCFSIQVQTGIYSLNCVFPHLPAYQIARMEGIQVNANEPTAIEWEMELGQFHTDQDSLNFFIDDPYDVSEQTIFISNNGLAPLYVLLDDTCNEADFPVSAVVLEPHSLTIPPESEMPIRVLVNPDSLFNSEYTGLVTILHSAYVDTVYIPYRIIFAPGIRDIALPLQANYFELISTYIEPENLNVEYLFRDVNQLVIVEQDDGRTFIPPWFNRIGFLNATKAYRFYCLEASQVSFAGRLIAPDTDYTLEGGRWNWMGYPLYYPLSAVTALAEIDGHLVVLITDDGRLWLPLYYINTIGLMYPGEGYYIFVDETLTFHYNVTPLLNYEEDAEIRDIPVIDAAPIPTGKPYVIIIQCTPELLDLEPKSAEICSRNSVVGKGIMFPDRPYTPVIAWEGSTDFSLPGFQRGQEYSLIIRDFQDDPIPTVVLDGDTRFSDEPFAEILMDSDPAIYPHQFKVASPYPNPFNTSVSLPFALPLPGKVEITIFNILGRRAFHRTVEYSCGNHVFTIASEKIASGLGSGLYFIQMRYNGEVQVRKALLLR